MKNEKQIQNPRNVDIQKNKLYFIEAKWNCLREAGIEKKKAGNEKEGWQKKFKIKMKNVCHINRPDTIIKTTMGYNKIEQHYKAFQKSFQGNVFFGGVFATFQAWMHIEKLILYHRQEQ